MMSSPSYESDQAQNESSGGYISMEDAPAGPSSARDGVSDGTPSPGTDHRFQRRHRKQAASTFRLESPIGLSNERSDSRSNLPRQSSPWRSVSRRGKEPVRHQSDESQLVIPKRNSQQRRQLHASKPSIGSSPLSNVVSHEETDPNDTPYTQGSSTHAHPRTTSSVGLDTDSAQIVNLALSLSDSRRRSSLVRTTSGGVQRPRLSSSVVLSRPQGLPSPKQLEIETPSRGPPTPQETVNLRYGATHYGEVQFSEATLARAEKAKQHFELFENYLRLLPYLPPLPVREETATRLHDTRDSQNDASGGRKYNPLQYLRNRKVRYRERQAIDSEAAGWGDVEKVAAWVDTVAESPNLHQRKPDEHINLPPFNLTAAQANTEDKPDQHLLPTKTKSGDVVRRRPRMDWITTPLDLLADAVWYEQDENKAKAEDRNGNKLFPGGIKAAPKPESSPSDLGLPGTHEEQRQDARSEPEVEQMERLPTFTPLGHGSQQSSERGRLRHRLAQSINFTPNHSSSRNQSKSPVKKRHRRSSWSSDRSHDSNKDGSWGKRLSVLDGRNGISNDKSRPKQSIPQKGKRPVTPNRAASDSENTPGHDSTQPNTPNSTLLPPLNIDLSPHASPRLSYAASNSSLVSDGGIAGSKGTPTHDDNNPFSTPAQKGLFPSMAINLSPLRGRSTSPGRRHPFYLGHSRKSSRQKQGPSPDTPESAAEPSSSLSHRYTHTSFSPPTSPFTPEDQKHPGIRRSDSSPAKYSRNANQQEWKRILKGGRIAELVGNEVSRVGDLIRKREHLGHSRQSSASSLSEYIDAEVVPSDTKLTTGGDLFRDASQRVDSDDYASQRTRLPVFTSISQSDAGDPIDLYRGASNKENLPVGDELFTDVSSSDVTKEEPHHSRSTAWDSSTQTRLGNITRNWSISTRHIPHSGRIGKRDISRVRTHLLSSGIKAVEICRYAERSPTSCVDSWLKAPINYNSIAPYIASSEASALATRKSIMAFHERTSAYNLLIRDFVDLKAPPMKAEIRRLENLVSSTLTPRIRELATQAESLTSDLGTASTLPVKQLENILNKGLRKRSRRIRSIVKLLSAVFEWLLMGLFWIVWISVMLWKIIRFIGLGAFKGIRWVLWL
ncbi:uncharacterized protein GIQ15_06196 [Arthroderma uncinatum]|uniref:uncharacterized protein n=1 Tax=Arthroderma uncinatum TaxID=74035 RepID=UPI00144A57D5|nr:uncharacterized protein GIQ15_06196 [Arthroderma uncinatum]KAF3480849.1 hypothetical protein GIQ15_06196 [Arthroderma uncinatum]